MSESNVNVVRRGYEAFGRGDIEGLLGLLDEQVQWVTPGPTELATSGRRTGRQQVGAFFGAVNDLFEIQRFEPSEFIAEGDKVVVLGSETARARSTGVTLDLDWVHVFTIRNGVIVAFQEHADTAKIVAALTAVRTAA
jgi:ketosteroid isomerase-like protein